MNILREELERRKGDIRKISTETGIAYDTVLRIKNAEGDPGFTKVERLAKHLGLRMFCPQNESVDWESIAADQALTIALQKVE